MKEVVALWDFTASGDTAISLLRGDKLRVCVGWGVVCDDMCVEMWMCWMCVGCVWMYVDLCGFVCYVWMDV